MSDFTAKDIEQALIDIDNLTSDSGETLSIKPTRMLLTDPSLHETAVKVEKAARKEVFDAKNEYVSWHLERFKLKNVIGDWLRKNIKLRMRGDV